MRNLQGNSMNISILRTILTSTVLLLVLTGCPEESNSEEAKSSNKSQQDPQVKKDSPKPQVDSSRSGESKPLSESAGGAEKLKKDELYEVPNRFPEKEWLKEGKEKQDEDKSEKKDEPPPH